MTRRDLTWHLMEATAIVTATLAAIGAVIRAAERDVMRFVRQTGGEEE